MLEGGKRGSDLKRMTARVPISKSITITHADMFFVRAFFFLLIETQSTSHWLEVGWERAFWSIRNYPIALTEEHEFRFIFQLIDLTLAD